MKTEKHAKMWKKTRKSDSQIVSPTWFIALDWSQ